MAGGQAVAEVVGTGPQVNGYEDASGNCHVPASRRGTPAKLTHVELLREEHRKLQVCINSSHCMYFTSYVSVCMS